MTQAASSPAGDIRLPIDEMDLALLREAAGGTTLAAAARSVGLTVSAANRRLSRLEQRLDLPLLHRAAGRIEVSADGRRVLAAGAELLGAVAAAQAVVDTALVRRSRLRVAGFGTNWDAFADDLAAGLPGVLFELNVAEPAAGAALFNRLQVDVLYAWQVADRRLPVSRQAETLPVLDEPLWVALPAAHPSATEDPVPLGRLSTDSWLAGPTSQARQLVEVAAAAAGFAPRLGPVVDSAPAVRSMVGQGLGVALVSPLATVPKPGAPLVHRPLAGPPRRRHVLVFDPGAVDRRLAHAVVHRLRRHYASTAACRNPRYRESAEFPVTLGPQQDPVMDPALLAGLAAPVRPAGQLRLDDLRLLHAVARTGSLNRAARVLMVSQPALSRRVRRLEDTLGTALLVRSRRGTVLLPLADALLGRVTDAVARFRVSVRGEG